MSKSYTVVDMDNQANYTYIAWSPYEALQKMKSYLDMKRRDQNAEIHETKSGLHLYLEHSGNIYAVRNE